MQKFMDLIELHLLPIAAKVGGQRHLIAVRDALISMIAVTMIGSFAVLLCNLGPVIPGYDALAKTLFGEAWKTLGLDIWWGTFAFMAVFALFGIAFNLAKSYGDDGREAMVIAAACFFVLIPQGTKEGWGLVSWGSFSATALFTAMFVGLVATEIFIRLSKIKKLTIKMPDGVPPAVARAFAKLLPGMMTIFIFALAGMIFRSNLGTNGIYFNEWINEVLVKPFSGMADSLPAVLTIVFFVHLFWFFGLHGSNIFGGIITPITTLLGVENTNLYAAGVTDLSKYHVFAGSFLDVFVYMGGAGCTLGFLIAIFLASKKQREIAELAIAPGVFQINEPVIFGTPIVLNPMLVLPFIITPLITATVSYLAIQSGLVFPIVATVPWVTPVGFGGYLATGGHISGAVLAIVNLAISIVIYLPFVAAINRQKD
ncbi:MAG: PTS transporter subunit EIIC [Bacillota bacterium]